MLEDDNTDLSQITSDLISRAIGVEGSVVPSKCAEALLEYIQTDRSAVALFIVIALLDFKSEVVMTDEGNDEFRVFDQNERYNINLEETIWTRACADKIKHIYDNSDVSLPQYVLNVTQESTYKPTLEKLCGNNFIVFNKLMSHRSDVSVVINPKIPLFISDLVE